MNTHRNGISYIYGAINLHVICCVHVGIQYCICSNEGWFMRGGLAAFVYEVMRSSVGQALLLLLAFVPMNKR